MSQAREIWELPHYLRRIGAFVAEGWSDKDIAAGCKMSLGTVKAFVHQLRVALGCSQFTRVELALRLSGKTLDAEEETLP